MLRVENRIQKHRDANLFKRCRNSGLWLFTVPLLAVVLTGMMLLVSRQAYAFAQKEISLFVRIERAIKEKEPDWKLVQRNERKGAEQKYFEHGWTLGEEYVSATTHQIIDTTKAVQEMADFLRAPVSAPVRCTEVPGLGDEAYACGDSPYSKKGTGTLIVRRVNIIIRLDASSLETAKRFAKHMVDEVDYMCSGALCEPMSQSRDPIN